MKKLILLFTLIISGISFSQLNQVYSSDPVLVGKVKTVKLLKKENFHTLCFYNKQFKNIDDFTCVVLENKNNEIDQLHENILKGFGDEETQYYQFPGKKLIVGYAYEKNIPIVFFMLKKTGIETLEYSDNLTMKDVNTLFGF